MKWFIILLLFSSCVGIQGNKEQNRINYPVELAVKADTIISLIYKCIGCSDDLSDFSIKLSYYKDVVVYTYINAFDTLRYGYTSRMALTYFLRNEEIFNDSNSCKMCATSSHYDSYSLVVIINDEEELQCQIRENFFECNYKDEEYFDDHWVRLKELIEVQIFEHNR